MTSRQAPHGADILARSGTATDVVERLVSRLSLEEKVAQLYGVWVGASADGGDVAPNQHELTDDIDIDALLPIGLGQLTRPFGTVPVDPALGALSLLRLQQRLVVESGVGIPALAHEECLAGFAAWGATAYPVPLSWGAAFAPDLVERMARRIGEDMASVGIHQGLAPVLDVVRDARWGRVEETIGEDPYLVGTIGTAYVRGLESAGIVATLKHFVGYSASRTGRNLAPVSMGPRERADVMLQPFEMVLRDGKPRSVMNAYTDTDGVASARATARFSPVCSAMSSDSTAPSSPTTSRSPSSSCITVSSVPSAEPPRSRLRLASTSSCRPCERTAVRSSRRCARVVSTRRLSTRP
jgi:beta-xylosidase